MYNIDNKYEAVRELQRLLDINRTGNYDEKTRDAVTQTQRDNGLNPTGITDYKTFLVILEDHRKRVAMNPNDIEILFKPEFPYKIGDMDSNVSIINSVIRNILSDYSYESKMPYGEYYGIDTAKAVRLLREIFLFEESEQIDATLFKRMLKERNAIEFKNALR